MFKQLYLTALYFIDGVPIRKSEKTPQDTRQQTKLVVALAHYSIMSTMQCHTVTEPLHLKYQPNTKVLGHKIIT